MNSATVELACALVNRPSLTPTDAGCLELIGRRLAACGFRLEYLPFGAVANLWAECGSTDPVFTFAGHTDVVPPGDRAAWDSDPFAASIRDGMLYGRGAADMKGALAAMVTAAERFIKRHPDFAGMLSFLLTSDEEGPALDGTARVVEHLRTRGRAPTWCLVGEPSTQQYLGDLIRNGRRGSLNGRLFVEGTQGHVAYPEKADNPVHRALPALDELCATQWDAGNEFYPPTSFQISNVAAGAGAENVIPGVLEVWFNFRYSTATTAERLKQAVARVFDRHGLTYRVDWHLSGEPFLTAGGDLRAAVEGAIEDVLGRRPALSTGGGTSDGRFIAPTGAEVIEFGPSNATIHKVNECVGVDELDLLSATYERILERLLAR